MTITSRMRSFVSRFVGSLRAAPVSEPGSETSAANESVAESLRDTVPVRRWHCQRLPIHFSLRLPLDRRAGQGNRDAS